MSEIVSNDYFDLGAWQSWNFMDWSSGTIHQAGLDQYLASYAQQLKENGLKQTTLSFAQVCDIGKMIGGDFGSCSKDSSLEMVSLNTNHQQVDGKSVLAYMAQKLSEQGISVSLSFGGASAGTGNPDDWDFGFSSSNPPAKVAKDLADWARSCGLSGIDFDMETGAEGIIQTNGASNLADFFQALHEDAKTAGMPVTLTVMGDSGDWGPEGRFLGGIFSQGSNMSQMFDGVNLMLYNGQYYLNAGQTPLQSWDLTVWIAQIEKNTGMSPSDCASFLHVGFDGGVDYTSLSGSGGPLPYDPTKVPPSVKTNGQYGAYIFQQIQNELRSAYSDPALTLGSSFFWDDKANYTVDPNNYESQFFSSNQFEKDFYSYLQ